jgi:hypothetical protein
MAVMSVAAATFSRVGGGAASADQISSPPRPATSLQVSAASARPARPSLDPHNESWAGMAAYGQSWDTVEATWKVPNSASGGSGAYSAQWVGVGLGTSADRPLVQAGSEVDGNGRNYLWYQIYPQQPAMQPLSGWGDIRGHNISVHVTFPGNTAIFHITDHTTGRDRTFPAPVPGSVPDGYAEVIVERPYVNNGVPPLANFGSVVFFNAQVAAPNGPWTGIRATSHYGMDMYNGSHQLTANVGVSTTAFGVVWKAAT